MCCMKAWVGGRAGTGKTGSVGSLYTPQHIIAARSRPGASVSTPRSTTESVAAPIAPPQRVERADEFQDVGHNVRHPLSHTRHTEGTRLTGVGPTFIVSLHHVDYTSASSVT